ncbi:hypothetical protein G7Y89_g14680 [Cudoniella acicularis]|uniref:LYR motif-containing protein Cup1-like N-terminal domain-containing protein n=1 Tax=Cudoniella acicularis TaxID=354080 RepID=A0A8H4VRW0_9HELO|nr:hypothetical protein G7Y89_g14680 [Cudoniella acicularis]
MKPVPSKSALSIIRYKAKPPSGLVFNVAPLDKNHSRVYRRLLRALSYFPDSVARIHIARYAVEPLKASTKAARGSEEKKKELIKKRITRARQLTIRIEQANNGNLENLKKMLSLAYGREGRRRRVLVADLLKPDKDEDVNPEVIKDLINASEGPAASLVEPSAKVQALLKSQQNNPPSEAARPRIKNTKAPIPVENIWGRPIPVRSQISMRKKWWADTLDRVYPPVPTNEWNRLRDIATGVIPIVNPQRRASPPISPEEVEKPDDVLEYLFNPVRAGGALLYRKIPGNVAAAREKVQPEGPVQMNPQSYQRTIRRVYASIWNMTPLLLRDEHTKKWVVEWGKPKSEAHSGAISTPSLKDMELFEGLPPRKAVEVKATKSKEDRQIERSRRSERIGKNERSLKITPQFAKAQT